MKCKEFERAMTMDGLKLERVARVKSLVMQNGERYSTLVDNAGMPLYYPTLYITTKLRNASLAHSTLVNEAAAISVLLQVFHERGIDIHKRIESGVLLKVHEIDQLRDACQKKILLNPDGTKNKGYSYFARNNYVALEVEYARLTTINQYLKFLCGRILPNRYNPDVEAELSAMLEAILARRPRKKNRNAASVDLHSEDVDIECLFEVLRPGSEHNPWDDEGVQVRNRLSYLLLYELGIRRGELLNLRCDDFDFSNNRVSIVRRADEKFDVRANQPNVKTNERLLSLNDRLAGELVKYITTVRNNIPNAKLHPYLLVVHKPGPTVGMPLTISGYKTIAADIQGAAPGLSEFTGHKLRHYWNHRFSSKMDTMDNPPTEAVQEKMRSYAMGWKQGSGTSATYNKRFIERKAREAGMLLQQDKIRLPEIPF